MVDRVTYYDHLSYILPLGVNHSTDTLTQFSTNGEIIHQMNLSKPRMMLLVAFLESPGHYLSRVEAMNILKSDLEVVKQTLTMFNQLLGTFNMQFSAVMGQGYILQPKTRELY